MQELRSLMNDLAGNLIPAILSNGAPLLGLLLLLGAIGVPMPTTILVMASGAFVRQGIMDPDSAWIGLCCVVTGDSLSFAMGRLGYGRLERRFHSILGWHRAIQTFRSSSGVAIYLTRWLFPSIAIPTNLLAGGSGYRYDRFLFISLLGEITWISVYGGLGYALGSHWETLSQKLPALSSLVLGMAILLACVYWCVKKRRMNQAGFSEAFSGNPVVKIRRSLLTGITLR